MSSDIDWDALTAKLPFEKEDEAKEKRKQIFKDFDINANGYLSLSEVENGLGGLLECESLFDAKPAIHAAFHFARKQSEAAEAKAEDAGEDFLQFKEFRIFLQTLRQYFEFYQAFGRIDTGDDDRITKDEFCSDAVRAVLEKWAGPLEDPAAEFDSIDTDGGGKVLFTEFVQWALAKNLDLEGDDE